MKFRTIQMARSVRRRREKDAYTIVEVLVSVFLLGIMVVSLYGGFTAGFAVVQLARENMRATQIMVQRIETMRLFTWQQIQTTNSFLKPTFTDRYDPSSTTGAGTVYVGIITTNGPFVPNAIYTTNMRAVKVELFWTNYIHGSTNIIVRKRQMQTHVARYGMQQYLYQ